MKKFCLLLDTCGERDIVDILPNDTYVEPFSIIVYDGKEEKIYKDWYEISTDEVAEMIKKGYDVKTSQTPVGVLTEKLENLLEQYEKVAVLTITKEFSGTYNTYLNLKTQLEAKHGKNRILVVDTKGLGYMQNQVAKCVVKGLENDKSFSEIEKDVKKLNDNMSGFVIITNAKQLVKGGRLKGLKALLVRALTIKLVIEYDQGKLEFKDKAMNLASAIDKGFEIAKKKHNFKKNPPKRVVIISDFSDKDELERTTNYAKSKFSEYENVEFLFRDRLPTAVVSHLGGSYFGLIVYTTLDNIE